jgi:RNA methyltransferase, TrmH family
VASDEHDLVQRLTEARREGSETVLEGHHAIKHALRFGAVVREVVAAEGTPAAALPPELAEAGLIPQVVPDALFERLVPRPPPVPVVARAQRGRADVGGLLSSTDGPPTVLLEHPSHAGNVGATVRVAAAAGADALIVVGTLDPWSPAAVRGGAGLQYALTVGRVHTLHDVARPLVAFDPEGEDLRDVRPPDGALLAFGTERHGISDDLRGRADLLVRIPMRPRVSSLNLATAVAVALYAFTGPTIE